MLCPNCKEYMSISYFLGDEVEVYDCDVCGTHADVSTSYEIDCLLPDGDWTRHEVSFTDRKYFKSVMNFIKDGGQKIIDVRKVKTQIQFNPMEIEEFTRLVDENL